MWRTIPENTTDLSNLMDREVATGAHNDVLVQFNNIGSILPSFGVAIRKSALGPDRRHGSIIPLLFFDSPRRREAAGHP